MTVHPHMRGDNLGRGVGVAAAVRFTPTCVGTMVDLTKEQLGSRVHPHMRGDNNTSSWWAAWRPGSPPHAWGQSVDHQEPGQGRRFTPTCVGTIPPSPPACRRSPVHPHMRGDNGAGSSGPGSSLGSPPHAWGQLLVILNCTIRHRFTPTCVGTMVVCHVVVGFNPVHPHMRGDNCGPCWTRRGSSGSPPHAWGQSRPGRLHGFDQRFTPTCVGTMCPGPRRARPITVHPHMRGDNRVGQAFRRSSSGSPPHAWGQYVLQRPAQLALRFTPTCVGTIAPTRCRGWPSAVHPHMRGDNQLQRLGQLRYNGSPPHAWGQSNVLHAVTISPRFTPTCVGTISPSSVGFSPSPVHPHMRGDNSMTRRSATAFSGSPPHAWGQSRISVQRPPHVRFTPTCVGTIRTTAPCRAASAVHPHMRGDNIGLSLFQHF